MASHRSRVSMALAVVSAVLVAASCGSPTPTDLPDTPTQPLSADGKAFFTGPNIWTTPVPADAPADPRSAGYVEALTRFEPVVTLRSFTVQVFVADESAPRFRVTPTAPRTPPGFTVDVPIPPHVTIDPADNGHLAILDRASQCVYELYQLQQGPDGGWTANWANVIPADGDGLYPDGLSARSSGLATTTGLIWPEELWAGTIPHALVFAYPLTRAGGPVDPATRTDGRSTDPGALPIGAHLVLDPALDLTSLGLTPEEMTIAKALQQYGMILGDTSNGFTLYAVHPRSYPADPYESFWGNVIYADLGRIPFDRMKVLSLGPPAPYREGPPIPNRCTQSRPPG
jgi:hypothetical protein